MVPPFFQNSVPVYFISGSAGPDVFNLRETFRSERVCDPLIYRRLTKCAPSEIVKRITCTSLIVLVIHDGQPRRGQRFLRVLHLAQQFDVSDKREVETFHVHRESFTSFHRRVTVTMKFQFISRYYLSINTFVACRDASSSTQIFLDYYATWMLYFFLLTRLIEDQLKLAVLNDISFHRFIELGTSVDKTLRNFFMEILYIYNDIFSEWIFIKYTNRSLCSLSYHQLFLVPSLLQIS